MKKMWKKVEKIEIHMKENLKPQQTNHASHHSPRYTRKALQ